MPKRNRNSRKPSVADRREPGETQAAESLTIAWTVSVTGVLIADLMVVGAHFLARSNPKTATLVLFEGMLLLSAALMGSISLILLVLAWRQSQLKPPRGYVVFALLVAVAPIAATLARLLR